MNCKDHTGNNCQLCSRKHIVLLTEPCLHKKWVVSHSQELISPSCSLLSHICTSMLHQSTAALHPIHVPYSSREAGGKQGSWSPLMSRLCTSSLFCRVLSNNLLFTSKWPITVQWDCSYIPRHKEGQAGHNRVIQYVKSLKTAGWVVYCRIVLYRNLYKYKY